MDCLQILRDTNMCSFLANFDIMRLAHRLWDLHIRQRLKIIIKNDMKVCTYVISKEKF